jgi:hypothetical protein
MAMLPVQCVVLVCIGYSLKACLKAMCVVRLFCNLGIENAPRSEFSVCSRFKILFGSFKIRLLFCFYLFIII